MFIDKYNHISFDVWLTLIKSNPEFKQKRNQLIFEKYNDQKQPLSVVEAVVREIDVHSNKISEITGQHVPVEFIVTRILLHLNNEVTYDLVVELIDEIQKLFLEYPPSLYDEDTKTVLEILNMMGKDLHIISNTGFIYGETLLQVLKNLEIYDYFYSFSFSDECEVSKPNPRIFNIDSILDSLDLHVGDNPIADGGCVNVGIKFFQINSNNKTIKNLL